MYTPGEEETVEQYRKRRVKEYSEVFDRVSMILFEHDPIGLNFEENIDEYESEARMVISEFPNAFTPEELAERIRAVFIQMFDQELADRKKEEYLPIAKEIWEILKTGN